VIGTLLWQPTPARQARYLTCSEAARRAVEAISGMIAAALEGK